MAFRALIPPKIASPSTLSGSATAQRTQAMIGFYARLPKGNAPAPKTSLNPVRRYAQRYFDGPNASVTPLIHVLIAGVVIGYGIQYDHIYHSSHPSEGGHH